MKLLKKRNPVYVEKVKETVQIIANGEVLPERYYDHELKGEFAGNRECHVLPDLLLREPLKIAIFRGNSENAMF